MKKMTREEICDVVRVGLYLPRLVVNKIDESIERAFPKVSRNKWITTALVKELKRKGK